MKIEELDNNFKNEKIESGLDIVYYDIPNSKFALYGIYYEKTEGRFRRFPQTVAEGMIDSKNALCLSLHTSGGRLRFGTNSNVITVRAQWKEMLRMAHMPFTGSAGFILCEEMGNKEKYIATINPDWYQNDGAYKEIKLNGNKIRNYILYFPLYNGVDNLEIGLEKGARITCGRKYMNHKPILYYGSSITQGGCASRPDNMYPALISKWHNMDYINLGVSGHAKAEESMIEYLKTIDCCVFVYDYDHNASDAEYLSKTHYRLYEEFRKTHESTPVIMISSPNSERIDKDGKRVEVIKQSYLKAKENGDKNVYFIDGKTLFGVKDRENCMVDGSHPNDLGFYRMAKVIDKTLRNNNCI